jgi:hypothetical protein
MSSFSWWFFASVWQRKPSCFLMFFFGLLLEDGPEVVDDSRLFDFLAAGFTLLDVLVFFLRGRLGFEVCSSLVVLLIEGMSFTSSAATVFAEVEDRLNVSLRTAAKSFAAELPLREMAERVVSNKFPLPLRNSFNSLPKPSLAWTETTFKVSINKSDCATVYLPQKGIAFLPFWISTQINCQKVIHHPLNNILKIQCQLTDHYSGNRWVKPENTP